jgi:HPt (histidine-containing phosphotransfer) domain-containing protein
MSIALKDLPAQILDLENACKDKQFKRVNAAAHIIKGSSSSMRFSIIAKIAEKIESESTENWNDSLDSHLSELNSEWEIVKKIIRQKIN